MNAIVRMTALSLLLATATTFAGVEGAMIGCPDGQVVQGIDARTLELICVPAGGGVAQLVDRDNVAVGQYMGHGVFSRDIDGYRVDVCCIATAAGAALPVIAPSPLYSTPDCQGAPYFFADPTLPDPLYRDGSLSRSGDILFGGDPATRITARSFFHELEGCVALTEPGFEDVPVHPVVSIPLSSLGTPPFKIK